MTYIVASFFLIVFGIFYFILDKSMSEKIDKIKNNFTISYELRKLIDDFKKQKLASEILIAVIFSIMSAIFTSIFI